MKKVLLIAIVAMMALAAVGCAAPAADVTLGGTTWTFVSTINPETGETLTAEDLGIAVGDVLYIFEEDGTFTASNNVTEDAQGTYTIEGDKVTLDLNNVPQEFTISEDTMVSTDGTEATLTKM